MTSSPETKGPKEENSHTDTWSSSGKKAKRLIRNPGGSFHDLVPGPIEGEIES